MQYGSSSFCDLSKLQQPCIIYSIGPAAKEFEKAALENSQCQVHSVQCGAADSSSSSAGKDHRHKQHTACFGNAAAASTTTSSGPASDAPQTLGLFAHKLGHLRGIDVAYVSLQGEQLLQFLSQLKHGFALPRQLALTLQLPVENAKSGVRKGPAELALVFQHMAALGYAATSSKVTDAADKSSAGRVWQGAQAAGRLWSAVPTLLFDMCRCVYLGAAVLAVECMRIGFVNCAHLCSQP